MFSVFSEFSNLPEYRAVTQLQFSTAQITPFCLNADQKTSKRQKTTTSKNVFDNPVIPLCLSKPWMVESPKESLNQ